MQNIWKYRKKDVSLQQIIKLRHSFLNGHGRPRTAFLIPQKYGTKRYEVPEKWRPANTVR